MRLGQKLSINAIYIKVEINCGSVVFVTKHAWNSREKKTSFEVACNEKTTDVFIDCCCILSKQVTLFKEIPVHSFF